MQAIFFFLVSIGTLPPYPDGSEPRHRESSAIADLLKPLDALTLLISAIGHDVGHPGVNNAFLVALNAPLAQLYNDRSVLESFHCAAYSQILRRHWPQVFSDTKMRRLMIESILATDMGVHFKYMSEVGNLQEKLAHNNRTTDGWNVKLLEQYRDLTCGLLIKCADISNVVSNSKCSGDAAADRPSQARKFEVAREWANILTDEFSNQGRMENRLNLPTTLFGGPPVQDDIIKLGQSQQGFMNVFARPLFEAVSDILPGMRFSLGELAANKARWDLEIAKEKESKLQVAAEGGKPSKAPGLLGLRGMQDGQSPSPKSNSVERLVHTPPPSDNPTSSASGNRKGVSEPHALASVEAQAEAKRRILNPSNVDFTDSGSADPRVEALVNNTNASSRRGSADPSLTAILVTQQSSGSAPGGGERSRERSKKSKKDKRASVDSQTAGCGPSLRSLSPSKKKAAPANQTERQGPRVPQVPDENVASMADPATAYQRSDSVAVGSDATGMNGTAVPPQNTEAKGAGNGMEPDSAPDRGLARDAAGAGEDLERVNSSSSMPLGLREEWSEGPAKRARSKLMFWKRWRAVSQQQQQQQHGADKESMNSRERLALRSRGGDAARAKAGPAAAAGVEEV